jgi:hypothetical protein
MCIKSLRSIILIGCTIPLIVIIIIIIAIIIIIIGFTWDRSIIKIYIYNLIFINLAHMQRT